MKAGLHGGLLPLRLSFGGLCAFALMCEKKQAFLEGLGTRQIFLNHVQTVPSHSYLGKDMSRGTEVFFETQVLNPG